MDSPSVPDLSRLRIARDDAPPPSKKRRRGSGGRWITRIVILGILSGAFYLAWPRLRPLFDGATTYLADTRAPRVRLGSVMRSRPGASLELTTASGYVVPREKAALAAKVAGTLVTLAVDVGDQIEKGALVGRIDPRDWEHARDREAARVRSAQASVASARVRRDLSLNALKQLAAETEESTARISELTANLEEAKRVAALEERLMKSGAGIADNDEKAKNQLEQAQAVLTRGKASLSVLNVRTAAAELTVKEADVAIESAEADLQTAQASLAAALTDLDHTEIRAPFTGVILRKEAELGEIVVPALAGGGTSRGSVVTMANFNSLELEVDVFERDIRLVAKDAPVEILINAFPDLRLKGHVRQVVPTADRTKGTVQVKVAFDERDERVLPEMAGKVVFLKERPTVSLAPRILAPADAVITRGDQRGVLVFEAGKVEFRAVELGAKEGDQWLVTNGLSGGERVVLDPPAGLADGDSAREAEKTDE